MTTNWKKVTTNTWRAYRKGKVVGQVIREGKDFKIYKRTKTYFSIVGRSKTLSGAKRRVP